MKHSFFLCFNHSKLTISNTSVYLSEELKQVPGKLETLVREKHFLAAVTLLVSASKTISKPEMAAVGALSDLTRFFNEQLEVCFLCDSEIDSIDSSGEEDFFFVVDCQRLFYD